MLGIGLGPVNAIAVPRIASCAAGIDHRLALNAMPHTPPKEWHGLTEDPFRFAKNPRQAFAVILSGN